MILAEKLLHQHASGRIADEYDPAAQTVDDLGVVASVR